MRSRAGTGVARTGLSSAAYLLDLVANPDLVHCMGATQGLQLGPESTVIAELDQHEIHTPLGVDRDCSTLLEHILADDLPLALSNQESGSLSTTLFSFNLFATIFIGSAAGNSSGGRDPLSTMVRRTLSAICRFF